MIESAVVYRRLLGYTRKYWAGFAVAIVAMVVAAAMEPLLPAMMRPLLDKGFVEKESFPLYWVPAGIVGIFVIRGFATFSSQYALSWVSYNVLADVRRQMFAHMLDLPASDFEREAAGVLISRIVFEANNFTDAATHVLTVLVRDSLVVLGLFAFLMYLNWQLTMIALILVPAMAVIISSFSRRMRRLNRRNLEQMGELTRHVEEAVHGYKVIKVYGAHAREAGAFGETVARLRRVAMRITTAGAATTPITQVCAAVVVAVVVSIALVQSAQDETTVGGFVAFLTAMLMLLAPLKHLAEINAPLQRGLASAERVFELLDKPDEADRGTRTIARARGAIEFDNLSFRHPGAHRDALHGIDLNIRDGEVVALVGPSGGGKTSLLNLLPRFYSPSTGEIRLDGIPIESLTLASLREQIALVSQETVLFNDTIRANVSVASVGAIDDDRVWKALRVAALEEFVRSLPDGLDTEIGERGTKMSGGQRQRLAIARAVLKDAPILLLDEATSSLDSETERAVQLAIEEVMKGRTTLVIAHRLSTIERADRIVVMHDARIVEQGNHSTLMQLQGFYSRLYRTQFAPAEKQGQPQ